MRTFGSTVRFLILLTAAVVTFAVASTALCLEVTVYLSGSRSETGTLKKMSDDGSITITKGGAELTYRRGMYTSVVSSKPPPEYSLAELSYKGRNYEKALKNYAKQ